MAATIVQLIPAPDGLRLQYKDGHDEPAVCLALVKRGTALSVVPMEVSDGDLLLAIDNQDFTGSYWAKPVAKPVDLAE